ESRLFAVVTVAHRHLGRPVSGCEFPVGAVAIEVALGEGVEPVARVEARQLYVAGGEHLGGERQAWRLIAEFAVGAVARDDPVHAKRAPTFGHEAHRIEAVLDSAGAKVRRTDGDRIT